jgi:hypothetical protein
MRVDVEDECDLGASIVYAQEIVYHAHRQIARRVEVRHTVFPDCVCGDQVESHGHRCRVHVHAEDAAVELDEVDVTVLGIFVHDRPRAEVELVRFRHLRGISGREGKRNEE